MKYAIVLDGAVQGYREYNEQPLCKIIDGLATLRPVSDIPVSGQFNPAYFSEHTTVEVFDDEVVCTHTLVPVELEIAKQIKLKQLFDEKNTASQENVTVHGRQWSATFEDQSLLTQAILMVQNGLPLPAVWRDATKQPMSITDVSELIAIATEIAINVEQAFTHYWELETQLESDTTSTVEQIIQIVW